MVFDRALHLNGFARDLCFCAATANPVNSELDFEPRLSRSGYGNSDLFEFVWLPVREITTECPPLYLKIVEDRRKVV